jgi:hypothetical protein
VATDVTGPEPSDIAKPDVSPVERPAPASPAADLRGHRRRFAVIYALLALSLAAAVAGVVVYAGNALDPGPSWSSWKPSGGGLGAAHQIAEHIAPKYRLPNGDQLVDVIAKGPAVTAGGQTIPIPLIAVRGPQGKLSADRVVQSTSDNTFTFSLCGLGQACSIASGKPSTERATLVRREILELALYAFKYIPGIDNVIAFMPPRSGAQPQYAVYLRKDDLGSELKVPLTRTLATKTPLPDTIPAGEVRTVDAKTESRVYSFSLSQTQQGDAVLVLTPLPA